MHLAVCARASRGCQGDSRIESDTRSCELNSDVTVELGWRLKVQGPDGGPSGVVDSRRAAGWLGSVWGSVWGGLGGPGGGAGRAGREGSQGTRNSCYSGARSRFCIETRACVRPSGEPAWGLWVAGMYIRSIIRPPSSVVVHTTYPKVLQCSAAPCSERLAAALQRSCRASQLQGMGLRSKADNWVGRPTLTAREAPRSAGRCFFM